MELCQLVVHLAAFCTSVIYASLAVYQPRCTLHICDCWVHRCCSTGRTIGLWKDFAMGLGAVVCLCADARAEEAESRQAAWSSCVVALLQTVFPLGIGPWRLSNRDFFHAEKTRIPAALVECKKGMFARSLLDVFYWKMRDPAHSHSAVNTN